MLQRWAVLISLLSFLSVCGCTQKVPLSKTLFETAERPAQQIFIDDLALCVQVDEAQRLYTRHPSGFVGGGVPFQFELGNVLPAVTRDAITRVFNDVYPICTESATERIQKILKIDFSDSDLIFELSYASNKFDRAKYVGKVKVTLQEGGKVSYDKTRHVLGDFVNTSVGGDSGAFERAISRGVNGLIEELTRDEEFTAHFSRLGKASNVGARLDELDQLKDAGKITEDEYRQGRRRILEGI